MTDFWGKSAYARRYLKIGGLVIAILALLAIVFLGAFPVSVLKPMIEKRVSSAIGTPVSIDSISRAKTFSFNPDILMNSVTIKQPTWVGKGDFLVARTINVRISIWDIIRGDATPRRILLDGIRLNLVRDKSGRSNWSSNERDDQDDQPNTFDGLDNITVRDFRFTLDDRKRGLQLAGSVDVAAKTGLAIAAAGEYRGTPAKLTASGGAFEARIAPDAYPFTMSLKSPAAEMEANGTMRGILNTRNFDAKITAKAPTLKNLDYLIEAGLFGTQPVNLTATIHHEGRDWIIEKLNGTVGRSHISGNANILKRDGRTKLTGTIHATQLDFDDLADDAGLARAAALRARIGPRIVPNTRINLSKIGKTDIALDFSAARLLTKNESIFRSLKAKLTLDHRVITASGIVAKMDFGQMTGTMRVDHRVGAPKLSTDLRFTGGSLQSIVGNPDMITGLVEGRVRLHGSGDTIRQALSGANGKAAMIARNGSIKAIIADVIGQDLGKTIGQAISGPSERDPLHCMIASFNARGGKFAPAPLVISAGSSVGRGFGVIDLDGEQIALTIRGAAIKQSALKIADPIRIGGTLSAPKISVAGFSSKTKPTIGGALKIVGTSLGGALGINKKNVPKVKSVAVPVNCARLASIALK